jgi:hypothetical protein
MIRVDRAAPVIHYTMRAARAKPQVSDPDEFFGTHMLAHRSRRRNPFALQGRK